MRIKTRSFVRAAVSSLACAACLSSTHAAVVWNETSNGDLSNSQSAPTSVSVSPGVNSVIGRVGGSDSQDWLTITVPTGFRLTAYVLAAYASTDAQGFTGVQAGNRFVGDPFTASSYLGYAHYGTGATNGTLPPTNVIGTNLLPLMGNTSIATGARGFTPPLPSGAYTFLIQQFGATTTYQFDYTIAAVPGPATLAMTLACGAVQLRRTRRSAAR
jgi:hypothetical protein